MLFVRGDPDRESLIICLDRLTDIKGFGKEDGKVREEKIKQDGTLSMGDGTEKMPDPTLPLNNTEKESFLGCEMEQLIEEEGK